MVGVPDERTRWEVEVDVKSRKHDFDVGARDDLHRACDEPPVSRVDRNLPPPRLERPGGPSLLAARLVSPLFRHEHPPLTATRVLQCADLSALPRSFQSTLEAGPGDEGARKGRLIEGPGWP